MTKSLPPEYYQLLGELQAVDFLLVELTLYLDTHPSDQQVITQFNENVEKRLKIRYELESKFGPLQQYGNSYADSKWSWHSAPWPWQV